jgi:hypothetical protein
MASDGFRGWLPARKAGDAWDAMGIGELTRRAAAGLSRGGHRGRIVALSVIVAGGLVALTSFVRLPIDIRAGGFLLHIGARPEPAATAQFLRGQQTFDARLIWESYSDRVVQALEDRGASVDETQRQLERLRQAGSPIQGVEYVGGHPIPRGSMEFYVVTRSGPCVAPERDGSQVRAPEDGRLLISSLDQTCRGETVYVPYVFTLDDKGKIDRVE